MSEIHGLPFLSYDVTRLMWPAYNIHDRAMFKDASMTEAIPVTVTKINAGDTFMVYGEGMKFPTACHEDDLTPIEDAVNDNRRGIYRNSNGKLYLVVGGILNVTTKKAEILYRPLYPCEIGMFSRTPENFDSVEENGEKKFVKVANR